MSELQINEKINKTLFVFFSDSFIFRDKAAFLNDLKNKNKDKFLNAQEIILPIPNDAPPEIPIMILSKANMYEIKFSRGRIDYISQESDESNIISMVKDIFSVLQDQPKHIGFVIYSYFEGITEEIMNSKMANLFSDAGKAICSIDDTSELFLRSLHKSSISLKDTTIITNNSFMLNSAMKINNKRKIYLEFDINTFPSETIEVNDELINNFIKEVFIRKNIFVNELLNKVFT